MLTLLGLAFMGFAALVVFTLTAVVLKIALRLILLPLLLIKWLVGGIVLMVVGPVIALVGLVLLVVAGAVLFVPLLPFLLLGALVWLLVRATARPAVV